MGDFAVVLGPPVAVECWLSGSGAPNAWQAERIGLAVWPDSAAAAAGPRAAVWAPDGRAVGAFAGVLFSDTEVQERLALRGLAVQVRDHAQLAVLDMALHGPQAVAAWRWQGSLACLNPGQRQALLLRDPLGVGWVGWSQHEELQLWSNRIDLSAHWSAVPPGVVLQLARGTVTAHPLRLLGAAQPFLRDRSAVMAGVQEVRDQQQRLALLGDGLRQRLESVVRACVRGTGGLAALPRLPEATDRWAQECSGLHAADQDLPAGAAVWSALGSAELLGAPPEVRERAATGSATNAPTTSAPTTSASASASPWAAEIFEPIERCDPLDRAERLWRARELPALLGPDRHWAVQHGRVLVAPHLDPAVLAWLGAFERADRSAWAALGRLP